jgi:hypothetical protein
LELFPTATATPRADFRDLEPSHGEEGMVGRTDGSRPHPDAQQTVAHGRLLSAHAQLSRVLAERHLPRVPPRRAVQLYCRALAVDEGVTRWLQAHLVRAGLQDRYDRQAGSHDGVLRFRDWLRVHAAPHGDEALGLQLSRDLARCRTLIAGLEARIAARGAGLTPREPEHARTFRRTAPGTARTLIADTSTRR